MSSWNQLRRLLLGLALAIYSFAAPWNVVPVRADNIGGTFEECAQLVEFVAPTSGDNGHLTLVGIGPGLYNDLGDETHHRFPFASGLSLSGSLVSQLKTLADELSFTCVRMTGDGGGMITALALDRQVEVCGTIARDRLGIFSINRPADSVHIELIADAQALLKDDVYLKGLLAALIGGPSACLNFQLDAAGVIESITVDVTFTACGPLGQGAELVVGPVIIANKGSSSADLLPAQALYAAYVVMPQRGTEGCVDLEVIGTRILKASLSAAEQVCGSVVLPQVGDIEIGGLSISERLLTSAQLEQLKLAVDGSACLTMTITANRYESGLTTVPPTPAPTASPSPTPSPSPSPTSTRSPSPTPSPSSTPSPTPLVQPTTIPTGSDGPPIGLMVILLAAAVAGLGGIGYVVWRRMRRPPPNPAGGGTGNVRGDVAVPGGAPPAGAPALADMTGTASAFAAAPAPAEIARLTPREQEVLSMLYEGLSNKEIGTRLFITESTAGVHVSNIMMKLGAKSRAEAAALAHRMGLTSYDGLQH
jgi:DNA-binding CsgD family transcriptional regulator